MADNVRAALALVARGEAVLGIVYETDAKVEPGVKIVGAFPADSHPPIIYPVAATANGKPEAAALSRVPALEHRQGGFREIRLHVPGRADVVTASDSAPCSDLSPPKNGPRSLLSLRIALVATLVALPFGIAVAWLLARKDFWGKALLDGIVHLPLVLPPVVTGYLLLIWFGRRGPIGAFLADTFGIVFSFRWTGAALACGVMGFPLLVRAIRLSFEAIDAQLEDAAATLGANRLLVFAHRDACRSRCPASSPAWCCALPRRSASSAPPSPSSPTFRAKRRRSRPRSTPTRRSRAAMPPRCGW